MCSFSFNVLRSNFFTFITGILQVFSEILNIESLLEFFKFHTGRGREGSGISVEIES